MGQAEPRPCGPASRRAARYPVPACFDHGGCLSITASSSPRGVHKQAGGAKAAPQR